MPEIVAIDWEAKSARFVCAKIVRDKLESWRTFQADLPEEIASAADAAATGKWLRDTFRQHGADPQQAIVVLPRESVVMRRLDLPDVPDHELPAMARLQAATRASTPVDQLALDYLPLPRHEHRPGQSVLVFSCEASRLKRLRESFKAAEVDLLGCTTSATTVGEVVARADASVRANLHIPTLVVYQRGSRVELSIYFDQGHLIFSHGLRLPSGDAANHVQPLKSELSRSIVALGQVHEHVVIERAIVVQEDERDSQIVQMLEESFPGRVECIDPDQAARAAGRTAETSGALSAAALGAILAETSPTLPRIDFLRARKPQPPRDERKLRLGAAAAAALLVFAVGGWFYYSALVERDQQITELQQRESDLNKLLERNDAALRTAEAIGNWENGDVPPVETLAGLQALLTGTDRLYFQSLKFSPGTRDAAAQIRGSGFARTRRDFEELEQRLADQGYRVRSHTPATSNRDPDYPVLFELDVDVLRPKSGDAPEANAT